MIAADAKAPGTPVTSKLRELVRRWDWLLMIVIAPAILFLNPGLAWALLAIPLVLLLEWLAWGEIFPVTPLNPAILILEIMVGVSMVVTPDLTASLGKIGGLLFGIAVYYCSIRHTRTQQGWRGSLVLLILCGMGIALVGLVGTNWSTQKITWLNVLIGSLPTHIISLPGAETGIQPNELAGALLWVIPLILLAGVGLLSKPNWFISRKIINKHHFWSIFGWAVFLIITFIVTMGLLVLSQTRGSLLAIAVAGLVLLILIVRGKARWWVIGLLAVDAFVGMFMVWKFGWNSIFNQVLGSVSMNDPTLLMNTMNARVEIWSRAIWAIKDVPLTGLGMNVFRSAVALLYPTLHVTATYNMGHAHSELLQVALDLGLPGVVAFIALYLGAFGMLVPAIRSNGAWRFLALGLLGGLLAHFLYGITDAIALGAKPGFLFWWLLGMVYGLYDQNRTVKAK